MSVTEDEYRAMAQRVEELCVIESAYVALTNNLMAVDRLLDEALKDCAWPKGSEPARAKVKEAAELIEEMQQ